MRSQIFSPEEILVHDVWGERCIECDSKEKPIVTIYYIKNEEIAVLNCSKCEFTIVVVEIDKLQNNSFQDKVKNNKKAIVATHSI